MRKLFLIMAISAALFSCKKDKSNQFLNGQLVGLGNEPVYLISGTSNNAVIDTLKVRKDGFVMEQSPEDARMITLILPQNRSVTFYADADSRLTVSGNVNAPYSIYIEGDSVNNKLTEYRKSVFNEVSALYRLQQQAEKAWNSDSLKHYEELLNSPKAKALRSSLKKKTESFVSKNNSSPASVLAIRDYLSNTSDNALLKNLLSGLKTKSMGDFAPLHELKLVSKQLPKIAGSISSFQSYNTDNKADYFYPGTGKRMVLLFWKSDDKYSAYLNKKLSAAFEKCNKDSVNYTAISLDDSYEDWKSAINKGGYKGKQLLTRGGFQNENIVKTGISHTPFLLSVSKNGSITAICENDENPLK